MDHTVSVRYLRFIHSTSKQPYLMSSQKVSRKELAARLVDKIQETLNELDAGAAKKSRKSAESAARKVARKFGLNLKKAKKKAKGAEADGGAESKGAKKARKLAKTLMAKAARKAKAPSATDTKPGKIKKKDLSLAVDGQA